MAAAAPASSDPQEGQAMVKAEAEAAEASIRLLVPVKVKYTLRRFLLQMAISLFTVPIFTF